MKYAKLRGRIREKFSTQAEFARAIGYNPSTVSAKLCGKVDWTRSDIIIVCRVLDIPSTESMNFFS